MARDDVIASAVNFLQDPSVASSPLDKKIAFLQSKNLTKNEIDISLARANDGFRSTSSGAPPAPATQYPYPNAPVQRIPPGYEYGYGPYASGPWAQPPAPRRDWRDWFIMATLTSGLGYVIYTAAKRYVVPLIAPPTPAQLEQDKATIDEQFSKAFALIDQLAEDTAAIKASESERAEKLDTTIKDVNSVIADLKAANARRETENRMIADQVSEVKGLVPKALEGWKASGDARLEDLSQEMQSLKKLLENRVGRTAGTNPPISRGYPAPANNADDKTKEGLNGTAADASPSPAMDNTATKADGSAIKRGGINGDRRAAIPDWQRADSQNSVS